jgi:hypothetical protein
MRRYSTRCPICGAVWENAFCDFCEDDCSHCDPDIRICWTCSAGIDIHEHSDDHSGSFNKINKKKFKKYMKRLEKKRTKKMRITRRNGKPIGSVHSSLGGKKKCRKR